MRESRAGVLLLTFGTAKSADDVPGYLASVRGGREAPPELVAEFRRRFELVGGSPLIEITRQQAEALERLLNARNGSRQFAVRAGMRHSAPTIAEGLAELRACGATDLVGIILAPQFSPRVMGAYLDAVAKAETELGLERPVRVARSWHEIPALLDGVAQRLTQAMERMPAELHARVGIVFTAHSLPQSVADNEPQYLDDLWDTATAVAIRSGLSSDEWCFAYQSAGHTPEPWLKPDLTDVLPILRDQGRQAVLVVPVQFLSDHLEILYDIDIAAREQAEREGLRLFRTESLNTSPFLIDALASVVDRELAASSS
ncbi:MAG: ferrochelatase [Chloroflexi bacterium]|nr:ferrochelatase [Chloroflexota bacterium]